MYIYIYNYIIFIKCIINAHVIYIYVLYVCTYACLIHTVCLRTSVLMLARVSVLDCFSCFSMHIYIYRETYSMYTYSHTGTSSQDRLRDREMCVGVYIYIHSVCMYVCTCTNASLMYV